MILSLVRLPLSSTHLFNQLLDNWGVFNVTSIGAMFYGVTSFDQDLSQWCVANLSVNYTKAVPFVFFDNPYAGTYVQTFTPFFGITLDNYDGTTFDRSNHATAVWVFIPNEQINIVSVNKDIDIDVKHFSNGTCLYFYLAALTE